ncbi:MAG TPA: hypothetical protein VIF62_17210 [Labilithrix sp.]|jgi:hypothetical protein
MSREGQTRPPPPPSERTARDVGDPDASGPTDVIELPPDALDASLQPSSIAPIAFDVGATAPRSVFRESVNFVQAPVRPRKSGHLAWLAICATAGIGLIALIAGITIAVESSAAPVAVDARPVHVARRAEASGVRSVVVVETPLATTKSRRGFSQRH